MQIENPFCNASSYSACLGIDWSHSSNCVHLAAAGSTKIERMEVQADPASMKAFVLGLRERFAEGKLAVVSEQSKGALVNLLLDFDFVDLFAVNPNAAAKFRLSLHPSGSKSDPIDSSALLRMVYTHRDKMAKVSRGDEATRRLDGISRHRRALVDHRVKIAQSVKNLLREYYPLALSMLGEDLWTRMSVAFLRRWPSYSRLAKARDSTLERFYYASGCRSAAAIAKRLESRRSSIGLCDDAVTEELGEMRLADLLDQIAVLNRQIRESEKELEARFREHPDRELFAALPGAGPAMAPRLAAAFGCDRERFESCSQMQAYAGIAPIKVASGNSQSTFMRRFCPKFIRQTFHEWAGLSCEYSPWAKAYYKLQKERGKRTGAAKRALAFKWMRILFKCWNAKQPYDEARYVRSLIKRRSPIVQKMKSMGFIDDENNIIYT